MMTDERFLDLRSRSTDHFFDGVWTARSAREFIAEIDRLRKENRQLRVAQSIIEHERDALIARLFALLGVLALAMAAIAAHRDRGAVVKHRAASVSFESAEPDATDGMVVLFGRQ